MTQKKEPIAIVGIGCRFPSAKNPAAFWQLLQDGGNGITEVPPARWNAEENNITWGGFLEQVEYFDPHFFGISPKEATTMDPQQRLLLEVTWEALEDGGIIPESLAGTSTGVFIGVSSFDYYELLLRNAQDIGAHVITGNTNCIVANRISYFFNLTGPSISIDTACSSSLVVVNLACQSLWSGECSQAIVGGVHIMLSPWVTQNLSQGGMLAADGRCKTFDEKADGYVRSEGVGVVVVKPLSAALAAGDRIYSVILGGATNQDGRTNGLTAPNPKAQEALLRKAYQQAGRNPSEVQYIEAQGTGTKLGDFMEMEALGNVLAQGRSPQDYCAVGSVKTNIGHLEAASGIAGLIKVALSIYYQQIPPTLHCEKPSSYIPFDKLLLRVQQSLETWPNKNGKALAGVSAFGFGGTNAHVVLESAPEVSNLPPLTPPYQGGEIEQKEQKRNNIERPLHLFTLSAKSDPALKDLVQSYLQYLSKESEVKLTDICFTANAGRTDFNHRLALVIASKQELFEQLSNEAGVKGTVPSEQSPKIAFLFTSKGEQALNLGWELYQTQPTFKNRIDRCQEIINSTFPPLTKTKSEGVNLLSQNETAYSQLALFALEYALFELWQSWGIKPSLVMGDEIGEYIAACVAGVFSLEDGLKLIYHRSRFEQQLSHKKSANLAEFKAIAETITYFQPKIKIVSAVTGKEITSSISTPQYWCDQLGALRARNMHPTNTTDNIKTADLGYDIFIEISCNSILLEMGQEAVEKLKSIGVSSLQTNKSAWEQMLSSLAKLYVSGVKIDWFGFDKDYLRQKVALPNYPFQRQKYWIEIDKNKSEKFESLKREEQKILEQLKESHESDRRRPPQSDRQCFLETYLQKEVSKILGVNIRTIDINSSLNNLGINSLNAMEMRDTIRTDLGLDISIEKLFDSASLREIGSFLLEQLNKASSNYSLNYQIEKRKQQTNIPLGFTQEKMWEVEQLKPGSALYNVPFSLSLTGKLEVKILEESINETIQRQEALRTTIAIVDNKPVQAIAPFLTIPLRVIECDETEVQKLKKEEATKPFNLTEGPLIRATLLQLGNYNYYLLVTTHHIISDGWSVGIFIHELAKIYQAKVFNQPLPLSPLPFQYGDYTEWEQKWLTSEEVKTQLSFWKKQLKGNFPLLKLPLDYPRLSVKKFRGGVEKFTLSQETTQGLKLLSKRENSTLFMTLIAALESLIYTYTGETNFCLGTFVANRNLSNIQQIIGLFINCLPIVADCTGNPTFCQLLNRVCSFMLKAYDYQQIPGDKILDNFNHKLEIQVVLILHNELNLVTKTIDFSQQLKGKIQPYQGNEGAKRDLTFHIIDLPDGLTGYLEYDKIIFKKSTIIQIIDDYTKLIQKIVINPEETIANLCK